MRIVEPFKREMILILIIIFISVCFYNMLSLKSEIYNDDELINGEMEIPILSPDDFRLGNIYSNQSMFEVYDIIDLNRGINGIASADFNNDGLIDCAIVNHSENSKRLKGG